MLKNIKKVLPGMKFTCEITKNIVDIQKKGFLVLPNGVLNTHSKILYDTYEEAYEYLISTERTFRNLDTIINEAFASNIVVYDQSEDSISDRLFYLATAYLDNLEDEILTIHASQEMLRHLYFGSNGVYPFRRYEQHNFLFHDEFMWDEKVIGKYKELAYGYPPHKKHLIIFCGRYQSIFGAY